MRNFIACIVCLAVAFAASGIGSIATVQGLDAWYAGLRKPAWNPPSWVFGPVWTALYAMMGVASFLVWKRGYGIREEGAVSGENRAGVRVALGVYLVHLAFNASWSWVFFAWREPGWAVVNIVLLWVLIVATMVRFAPLSRAAAWMLGPYLAWVTFATALNFTIWRLNAG